jgi:uncharacterized membrane protein YeaQ/YmgE (transglycosylase-associated protein family)
MHVLTLFLIGAVVGLTGKAVARRSAPGESIITMLLGVAGAMMGALVGRALHICETPTEGSGVLMSMLGAMALLLLYRTTVVDARVRR